MKFAVTMSINDILFTNPISVVRHVWKDFTDAMNRQKEEGKVQEVYIVPGRECNFMAIYLARDADELWERFNELPSAGMFRMDTYNLADFNEGMKLILKNMEASEDFMPGGTVK